jgi:hypothetical protein
MHLADFTHQSMESKLGYFMTTPKHQSEARERAVLSNREATPSSQQATLPRGLCQTKA